jgi:hypothetical protein
MCSASWNAFLSRLIEWNSVVSMILAVVRENHLLAQKASHEARLIKAIQHTGRLGKFVSLVLDEAT